MHLPLKDFSGIVSKFHQFRYRGKDSRYFTPNKNYTIHKKDNWDRTAYTTDDMGNEHALSLNYFNENCQLIETPIEILEMFDDMEDALINGDIAKFCHLSSTIQVELSKTLIIQEKDVEVDQYYEHKGQRAKIGMFDDLWVMIRQPKQLNAYLTLDVYGEKAALVRHLNAKNYKRVK